MGHAGAAFVAVDWGTTRLRAYLIGAGGVMLDRGSAPDLGVQSIAPGGFPAALDQVCATWFAGAPDLPVIMAGMVGSRNGWVEAPYAPPPAGADTLAGLLLKVDGAFRPVFVVPGVDYRGGDGSYDIMRGEETQAIGVGVRDGLVCLPGTHSKWVELAEGRIVRFATFITGELYAALRQSFVGRFAEEPDDLVAGAAMAHQLAGLPGGLTRTIFQARSQILGGGMHGTAVRPFLASLLIETEVLGACAMFGSGGRVHLVAGPPQVEPYAATLAHHGFEILVHEPEATTVAGLTRLAATAGLGQQALR